MVKGRCMKEKKDVEMNDISYEVNAIGRPVVRGKCPNDGTSMYKIIPLSAAPKHIQEEVAKFKPSGARKSSSTRKSRKSTKKGSGVPRKSRKSRKANK